MRIMVTGLRGIPNVQGGIETHVERLYPILAQLGCDIEVIARTGSTPNNYLAHWKGIKITRLWAPKTSGLESFIHTFLAVIYAGIRRPDILHIHAIGPAIMTPIARLLGLKVVVTHHGPDYDREKWGAMAKKVLYRGEKVGMQWSSARIVISKVIQHLVKEKYNIDSTLIPNGVCEASIPDSNNTLDEFGLISGQYVLQVSRIVPEKRQLDLIKAFNAAAIPSWKLVLVGKIQANEEYSSKLIAEAEKNKNIILTDFQTGVPLNELLANAGIFILPSSHEGLPIAILEALSFGLRVIASDIPSNLEIGLPTRQYFPLGNFNTLAEKLLIFSNEKPTSTEQEEICRWVLDKYDWNRIAWQTFKLYQKVMKQTQSQ